MGRLLDTSPSRETREIYDELSKSIVGQDLAKKKVAEMIIRFRYGLRHPKRPAGTAFFLGPTGVGKTEMVKAVANYLCGSYDAYTHISCGNIQYGHEVSKLVGAPPSYVGFDQEPMLSQKNIEAPDRRNMQRRMKEIEEKIAELSKKIPAANDKRQQAIVEKMKLLRQELQKWQNKKKFTVVLLFDEIEKAHPDMHKILLDMLSEGFVSINNGAPSDFTNAFVFMSSNLNGGSIQKIISHKKMGFQSASSSNHVDMDQSIYETSMAAVGKFLPPEIFGRIGKENFVVFRHLQEAEMFRILDLRLRDLQSYVNESGKPFFLEVAPEAKKYLIRETQDPVNLAMGARAIQHVVEKRLTAPLNNLMAKSQEESGITTGSRVTVRLDKDDKLYFEELE